MMNMYKEWELVSQESGTTVYRLRVLGGWIVRTNTKTQTVYDGKARALVNESTCFVSDPTWQWELPKEETENS